MAKLVLLKIPVALTILSFCACVSHQKPTGYSMAQATGSPQTLTPAAAPQAFPPGRSGISHPTQRLNNRSPTDTTPTNLPDRIIGGKVIRSESGLIVVQSNGTYDNLRPIDLTTDAVITSSLLSKIATQPRFRSAGLDVKSNAGVVSIHAHQQSLDDALTIINLALSVPEVRQVVYSMPVSA
jgi:hypothetical protein